MGNTRFQFKQFAIDQEHAGHKIGVDSVILGSWVALSYGESVLDVGTGTGLLALMLAQRGASKITGVELDVPTFKEAASNAQASPWADRMNVVQRDFSDLTPEQPFDLIISNPPYFKISSKSPNATRQQARQTDSLSAKAILEKAPTLLSREGRVAMVLPREEAEVLLKLDLGSSLFLRRRLTIFPRSTKPANRVCLEWGRAPGPVVEEVLHVYGGGQAYSEAYRSLTRDFYLHF